MNLWAPVLLTALIAYLSGSINGAVLSSRLLKRTDVRTQGSGNAGATNVFRVHGKAAAFLTLVFDAAKTVLAVLLARLVFSLAGVEPGFDPGYIAGLFVILGHLYPVFFRFRGGKGVLALLMVTLMVDPLTFALLAVVFLPVLLIVRVVSLVSILGAAALPVVTCLTGLCRGERPFYETLFAVGYMLLVLFAHRANIRRLLNGEETRIRRGE